MANPVINSVEVKYAGDKGYKLPGEAAEVVVQALDPDALTISVAITVKDAGGNETRQTLEIVQSDPLTITATSEDATVTPDPSQANRFYVV